MPPAEFEPAIPASDRPQNLASDRSATEMARYLRIKTKYNSETSVTQINVNVIPTIENKLEVLTMTTVNAVKSLKLILLKEQIFI
jgi:hypothetical protein